MDHQDYQDRQDQNPSEPTLSLELRFCRFQIFAPARMVVTEFPDGRSCIGTREDNYQNRREAESQGYTGEDAVWRSLVEHELLHSLVAEMIFGHPSLVLTTESGGEFTPSWLRYEEEMIVLSLQAKIHNSHLSSTFHESPLQHYNIGPVLERWYSYYQPALISVYDKDAE